MTLVIKDSKDIMSFLKRDIEIVILMNKTSDNREKYSFFFFFHTLECQENDNIAEL